LIIRLWNNTLRKAVQVLACIAITTGCAGHISDCRAETGKLAQNSQNLDGEVEILESWQGDYPVDRFNLLPEKQREQPAGFIDDVKTFEGVWKTFKPGEAAPKIDFRANLVLFARNTQFYNSIRIGKVKVKNGVAEVLAMETMSAMPIEDKAAMSLAIVPRQGIAAIQAGGENIPVRTEREQKEASQ